MVTTADAVLATERPGGLPAGDAALRFCVLTDGTPLAPWQSAALDHLASLPGVTGQGGLRLDAGAGPTAQLRERAVDFFLSFAPQAAARAFAPLARWGVWQFVFGDWARDRGQDGGRLAIARDEPVARAALVQLQADPDCVRILIEGAVRSHAFRAGAHERMLQERCAHWPRQLCLELLEGRLERLQSPLLRARPARPGRRAAPVRFALSAARRVAREGFNLLLRHEQWNVGILDAPIGSLLSGRELPAPRWLPTPASHEFYADPFGIVREGALHILLERMDYRTGIGGLAAYDTGSGELRAVDIGQAMHLSYPYLLEHEGRLLCVPETLDAHEVALYEIERFPDRWRRVCALVSGERLCDGTVFRHQGRWWLAASRPERRGASCELLLYHAAQLTGPWLPHAANPVKVDVRSARPAGTPFSIDGVLYRPAQDCAGDYGRRVVINRVLALSERSFHEEPCAVLEPPHSWPYAAGLHTVCAVGDLTIIDAKRTRFVPQQCALVLRFIAHRLRERVRIRPRR